MMATISRSDFVKVDSKKIQSFTSQISFLICRVIRYQTISSDQIRWAFNIVFGVSMWNYLNYLPLLLFMSTGGRKRAQITCPAQTVQHASKHTFLYSSRSLMIISSTWVLNFANLNKLKFLSVNFGRLSLFGIK